MLTCQRLSTNSESSRTLFLNWDFEIVGNVCCKHSTTLLIFCEHDWIADTLKNTGQDYCQFAISNKRTHNTVLVERYWQTYVRNKERTKKEQLFRSSYQTNLHPELSNPTGTKCIFLFKNFTRQIRHQIEMLNFVGYNL